MGALILPAERGQDARAAKGDRQYLGETLAITAEAREHRVLVRGTRRVIADSTRRVEVAEHRRRGSGDRAQALDERRCRSRLAVVVALGPRHRDVRRSGEELGEQEALLVVAGALERDVGEQRQQRGA